MRATYLFLAALSIPTAAIAQAEDCPAPPEGGDDISVYVEIPAYSVSHALSASQLTDRFGWRSMEEDMRVEGFADVGQAQAEWEYESLAWGWRDDPLGVGCLAMKIGVTFWYDPPIVLYVASDYPQGVACYGAVLRHEQQHYEVTKELADAFGRRLKRALENDPKIAKTWNPVRYYSTGERENELRLSVERATRVINGFARRLNDDMADANERLDSPSSYRKVYADCVE
jgi:hypothetical protein